MPCYQKTGESSKSLQQGQPAAQITWRHIHCGRVGKVRGLPAQSGLLWQCMRPHHRNAPWWHTGKLDYTRLQIQRLLCFLSTIWFPHNLYLQAAVKCKEWSSDKHCITPRSSSLISGCSSLEQEHGVLKLNPSVRSRSCYKICLVHVYPANHPKNVQKMYWNVMKVTTKVTVTLWSWTSSPVWYQLSFSLHCSSLHVYKHWASISLRGACASCADPRHWRLFSLYQSL